MSCGTSSTNLPANYTPLSLFTVPELSSCEQARLAWSDGVAPYEIFAAKLTDSSQAPFIDPTAANTVWGRVESYTSNRSIPWLVNLAGGSLTAIRIYDGEQSFCFTLALNVVAGNNGTACLANVRDVDYDGDIITTTSLAPSSSTTVPVDGSSTSSPVSTPLVNGGSGSSTSIAPNSTTSPSPPGTSSSGLTTAQTVGTIIGSVGGFVLAAIVFWRTCGRDRWQRYMDRRRFRLDLARDDRERRAEGREERAEQRYERAEWREEQAERRAQELHLQQMRQYAPSYQHISNVSY